MVREARELLFITTVAVIVLILGWSEADSGDGARLLSAGAIPVFTADPSLRYLLSTYRAGAGGGPDLHGPGPGSLCSRHWDTVQVIRIFPGWVTVGRVSW